MKKIEIKQTISDRKDELVSSYFSMISKYGMISAEEEQELAQNIHIGDRGALNKLICSNLRFVVSVAKQFQNRGLDLADLISEGNIGLMKAAEKFDETRGSKFITFAASFIQQAIVDALTENSRLVRLPHGQVTILNKIKSIQNRYEQQYNRTADLEEIAEELEISAEKLKDLLAADGRSISFNAPLCDEEDRTLQDLFCVASDYYCDSALENESKQKELDLILQSLFKERDIYIIRHTFGIGCEELSQIEIAGNLGLSRERVRQIRDNAIQKLREPSIYKRLRMCC